MVEPGVSVADVSNRIAFLNMFKKPIRIQTRSGSLLIRIYPLGIRTETYKTVVIRTYPYKTRQMYV